MSTFLSSEAESAVAWFALRVRARSELAIVSILREKGYASLSPFTKEWRTYSDRRAVCERPLFPGYVFCQFPLRDRMAILNTPAVAHIVGIGLVPEPVPLSEIEAVRQSIETGTPVQPYPYLSAGQKVRVTLGSLAGIEGILISVKGEDRLIVSVHLLQRSLALEIDRRHVEPLAGTTGNGLNHVSNKNLVAIYD